MDSLHTDIWNRQYKIPWHEPAFSRRMLAEHLSQTHDLASRRTEWIDRQVDWLVRQLPPHRPAAILDLGCGPGLYTHRLARRNHHCTGLDFGPASIEYARQHTPPDAACQFDCVDIRHTAFTGPFDLVMMLYGEWNVFAPQEAQAIAQRAARSLRPDGVLILETQSAPAVERLGRSASTEYRSDTGLFCERPHRCRTDNCWLAEARVAIQTFTIQEEDASVETVYRSTNQAWSDAELIECLSAAGLTEIARRDEWPTNNPDLILWTARKSAGCNTPPSAALD